MQEVANRTKPAKKIICFIQYNLNSWDQIYRNIGIGKQGILKEQVISFIVIHPAFQVASQWETGS